MEEEGAQGGLLNPRKYIIFNKRSMRDKGTINLQLFD